MPSTDRRLELKAKDIDGSDRLTAGCVCQWVNRPNHDQQHYYHHAPTVKPEAATAVFGLLVMGVRTPETR